MPRNKKSIIFTILHQISNRKFRLKTSKRRGIMQTTFFSGLALIALAGIAWVHGSAIPESESQNAGYVLQMLESYIYKCI